MMQQPDFPHVIDSSMRATFTACPRKFELQYLHHWAPTIPSIHLRAGGAFAKGLEHVRRAFWGEGKTRDQALAAGYRALVSHYGGEDGQAASEGYEKDLETMLACLVDYFYEYGWETDILQPLIKPDGMPAVEFSFALPIPVDHPQTGDPILYAGSFDMLATYSGSELFGEDDKTASQLGASWHKNWRLRSQITGYCWGARTFDYPVAGMIVRGVAPLKTKINHAQAIEYRSQWEIDRWHTQLCRDVERMVALWKEGYFDYDLDSSCAAYGGCTFLDVCSSPNPERWLEASFVKRPWNPLEKG